MKYEPISDEEAADMIGEGVHTGLRKGTDAPGSSAAWNAIRQDDSGWGDAVMWAVEGLTSMGYRVCKEIEDV